MTDGRNAEALLGWAGLGSSPAGRWGPEAGVGTGCLGGYPPWDRGTCDLEPQSKASSRRADPGAECQLQG